jgi:endonuclease/exonuclease/phosphatase (EEP) superfamily protein YafD
MTESRRSRPDSQAFLWAGIAFLLPVAMSRMVAGFGLAFDLVANVSYFAAIPLAIISAFAFLLGKRRAMAAAAVGAVVAAAPVFGTSPVFIPVAGQSIGSGSILFCNIHGNPSAWDGLRKQLAQLTPDIVAIVEADPAVIERIIQDEQISSIYPYRLLPRPGLEWPQVVMSRHPTRPLTFSAGDEGPRVAALFSMHRSQIVTLPIGDLIFTAEHVPSPRTSVAWELGNAQLRALGQVVRRHIAPLKMPVVLAGDFNTSPAGYRDRLMRSETGLKPDPETWPPVGTWPSRLPAYFRLPLDRIWANAEIAFLSRQVLDDIGSDHRPIYVRFRLTR